MARAVILAATLMTLANLADADTLDDQFSKLKTMIDEPLDAFKAEPEGSCESENLAEAGSIAETIQVLGAQQFTDMNVGDAIASGIIMVSAMSRIGAFYLDVADTAADRGCSEHARAMYRRVISMYTGLGYAELRQRAAVGLAEQRAAKAAPEPVDADSRVDQVRSEQGDAEGNTLKWVVGLVAAACAGMIIGRKRLPRQQQVPPPQDSHGA